MRCLACVLLLAGCSIETGVGGSDGQDGGPAVDGTTADRPATGDSGPRPDRPGVSDAGRDTGPPTDDGGPPGMDGPPVEILIQQVPPLW